MYNLDFNTSALSFPVSRNDGLKQEIKDFIPISFKGNEENFIFDPLKEELDWIGKAKKDEIERNLLVMPNCTNCSGDQVYSDERRGEIICLRCGTVINHHSVDTRGIKLYTQADAEDKAQNEPLKEGVRPLLKYKSGTPEEKRRERMNNRVEWKYKKVIEIRCELSKIKTMMQIPRDVEDLTMQEVERLFKTDILRGRYALATGIAIFYWACLESNSQIQLKDILDCYRHDPEFIKQIRASVKTLQTETSKKFIPKKDYSKYITTLCSKLQYSQATCTMAINLVREMRCNKFVISGNPIGFIGGCLLESCKETIDGLNAKRAQQEIAAAIEMTEVTVRRRAKQVRGYLNQMQACTD